MTTAKVLVVDDDPMISASLARVLGYEGYEVKTYQDGSSAFREIESFNPDIAVLDVMMPGVSGIEVCRKIKSHTNIPVLFLSARDEIKDRVQGLESGGDDYMIKPFAYEELLARLRVLLRRRHSTPEKTLHHADLVVELDTHRVFRGSREVDLSFTEYQLLSYLAINPRRVMTRNMILESVWGYDFEGESNIVDVYISYLRGKLESSGEKRLIHTIRGVGYVLRD